MELVVIGVLAVVLGIVGMAVMVRGTPPYSLSELRNKRRASNNGSRRRV